jgi:hypothetical protein
MNVHVFQVILRDAAQVVGKQRLVHASPSTRYLPHVLASRLWTNTLLFPAYVAFILLVVQACIAVWRLQRIRAFFGFRENVANVSARTTPATPTQGFLDEAKQHIESLGLMVILLRVSRLLGTMTLVGLTAFLVLEYDGQTSVAGINTSGKWSKENKSKRRSEPNETVSIRDAWVEVIYLALYVRETPLSPNVKPAHDHARAMLLSSLLFH